MHSHTPLVEQHIGSYKAWLKLECDQPTGSFKIRGMARLCGYAKDQGASAVVSSSGGNAGLAVAFAAKQLDLGCHVIVPLTTPALTVQRLTALGAQVSQQGEDWHAADAAAREFCKELGAFYAHPFDHEQIWAGHASVIDECVVDGIVPDAVVMSVGGGGLLSGVLEGMYRAGWSQVPVFAVETEGAASLHAAMQAGEPATLEAISTIALTLGARQVAEQARRWTQRHQVHSVVVSDRQALAGCRRFVDEQRRLVEPACGAALSAVYEGLIDAREPLVIACGGCGVSLDLLKQWQSEVS